MLLRFYLQLPKSHSSLKLLARKLDLPLYHCIVQWLQNALVHRAHLLIKCQSDDDFTIEERTRFRKRFIEGYDILTDKRYNLWLQKFCNSNTSTDLPPASSTCLPSFVSSIATSSNLLFGEGIPRVSTLKKILKPSRPEVAKPPNYPKNYAKVLTSAENLKMIQDKERLKNEMLAEKERKRQERERKRGERKKEKGERNGTDEKKQ